MGDKRRKGKKATIFRIFLLPLIGIMLVQSIITIGTLVVRRTAGMLEEYSGGMMSRLVENRRVILQNDMNQRWASVYKQEPIMNECLMQFLKSEDADVKALLASDEMQRRLLEQFFPECFSILQANSTTGIFVVLAGNEGKRDGEYEGFFIRDSDPNTNPANYTDLLLERGSKQLSREWNIPLDSNWTTCFHMEEQGKNPADSFFYEPWRAGTEYMDADTEDLGFWSMPFSLEKGTADSYEMITYSLPLRYEGQVYGVMGVEISSRYLYEYFPAAELNDSQQSGYMLAVRDRDGGYIPLAGKGILYDRVRSLGSTFLLKETEHDDLSLVQGAGRDGQGVCAVVCPLKLYSNNVPYEYTDWVLLGLNTEEELFGMSRQLYVWMVAAVLIGLIFGVVGIYFLVRYLTKPVQRLMQSIIRGREGLQEYEPSNILEIDALYDVIKDLTDRQKEAENILLEEKERYRIALESSKDIFFSYDLQSHILDIVNHKTMSGQWKREESDSCFIDTAYIYEEDRKSAVEALQGNEDKLYVQFRLKWPQDAEFQWVALSGKAVYDTDGKRWKIVGSIRDIQEEKEKEAEQLRKNTTDGVTGLYAFSAGMERIRECRRQRQDGFMINLFLDGLKETNEKNGIVFGDMILEELGILIRNSCLEYTAETGRKTVELRLDGNEFILWMEGQPREEAEKFIKKLLERTAADFQAEKFRIHLFAGMACGEKEADARKLVSMAKLAGGAAASSVRQYAFYEDISESGRSELPALQGREINTLGYGGDVSPVSVALNLFGKGDDFPAQMLLMIRKIGRAYQAGGVLVSVLQPDFNSNYLEYQWNKNGKTVEEHVRKYREEDKEIFFGWLGQKEVRYFSEEDSKETVIQCFLSVGAGQKGLALPMYDNGSYIGNLCILDVCREFTENPEKYQELAELGRVVQSQINQQRSDIASKAKSEFLSRMSHEIRTPMNGIIGMTAIALQKDQSNERIMDCLQKIQSSSDYLLRLINDILDMSKIESGKMKLEPVNFSIREMLDTIREMIMPQASKKKIDFVYKIELRHDWFVADRMRISQILINLLGNAVKFTPEEGAVTLAVCETEGAGETEIPVYFAVTDTGVGIAKEDQDRVFRSFEQASGTNPAKQQGTGLGLSISSRLVQMMGSNIHLNSEPGEGSTFSFTILLRPGESMESGEEKEEISFNDCHVLVVEDNELNAEIARCLLEERNFKVDCAYNGAEAVERIRTTEPGTYDVILMDIMMPVMDGLEATRTIRSMDRADCRTIPIVAMSANAFDDDLKKSVECGMNGHLSKPVEVDKLYKMLDEVLHEKNS